VGATIKCGNYAQTKSSFPRADRDQLFRLQVQMQQPHNKDDCNPDHYIDLFAGSGSLFTETYPNQVATRIMQLWATHPVQHCPGRLLFSFN
jgi:16S rRNA G966 N2-methylase RsmD